ncbi:MAG: hypothetical protein ACM3TT_11055 [Syntrophothermus sp.]
MPSQPRKQPPRPGWRDYYQMVTSFLMVILGLGIVVRSKPAGVYLMPVLVGLAFVAFGFYRISFFVKYFKYLKYRREKGAEQDA